GLHCDLLDLKIRRAQQTVRELQPLAAHELRGRLAEKLAKCRAQLRVVHARAAGEIRQARRRNEIRREYIADQVQLLPIALRQLEVATVSRRKGAEIAQRDVQQLVCLGARLEPLQRIAAVGAHDL